MKSNRTKIAFVVLAFCVSAPALAADPPRQHLSFDMGWQFKLGDTQGGEAVALDDKTWRTLDVPHDWSIELPFDQNANTTGSEGYLPAGIGWYRKHFKSAEGWADKLVSVQFDGIYMNSDVYLNGKKVAHQPYGYTTFVAELPKEALNPAGQDNVIAVRVDNSTQPNSRFYSGSGIYRHVWLEETDAVHIVPWGTYVTTPKVTAQSATVHVETTLRNETMGVAQVTISYDILDGDGKSVGTAQVTGMVNREVAAVGSELNFGADITVAQPQLWSLEKPALYRIRTRVVTGVGQQDMTETPFGIRSIEYDVDKGFLLNGQHVKMLGECLHSDGGAMGEAVPIEVWERRLKTLKEMGCNAIRCAHNPPAPEFLDLCDRLGFLVMDEAFDEWTQKKGNLQGSYSTLFRDNSQKDLTTMLLRDRNHPSIVMWSVGNEIGEQRSPNGPAILKALVDTVHRLDPTRPTTAACDNAATPGNPTPPAFMNGMDIAGYNYVDRWGARRELYFEPDKIKFPARKFLGTEDAGIGGLRGEYGRQIGEGEEARLAYTSGMIRAEQLWKFNRVNDYVIGYFTWTGIDYLGESRWPARSSLAGAIDLAGFPKDAFYFYQSLWTQAPMVHALPHWTWPGREGQIIPVIVYSNCDSVEVSLNGKSYGLKGLSFPRPGNYPSWNTYARNDLAYPTTADLHLSWDIPYAAGTLKITGKRQGKIVATEEIKTTGAPAAIDAAPDKTTIIAGNRGVAQLTVRILDAAGLAVPTANNRLTFTISDPTKLKLLATDNGDPTDHSLFQSKDRAAFNGLALGIFQAVAAGRVRITISSPGLVDAIVPLEIQP